MNPTGMNQDFLDVLGALVDGGVEFIIVGAHALAVHGIPRATGDIDVFVRPSVDNSRRLFEALQVFGAPVEAHGVSKDDFASPGYVYQIGLPPRRIDFLTEVSGLTFDEAWQFLTAVVFDDVAPCQGFEAVFGFDHQVAVWVDARIGSRDDGAGGGLKMKWLTLFVDEVSLPVLHCRSGVVQALGEALQKSRDQGDRSIEGIAGAEDVGQGGCGGAWEVCEIRRLDDVDVEADGRQESAAVAGMDQDSAQFVPVDQNVVGPFDGSVLDPDCGDGLVNGGGRQHRQVGNI